MQQAIPANDCSRDAVHTQCNELGKHGIVWPAMSLHGQDQQADLCKIRWRRKWVHPQYACATRERPSEQLLLCRVLAYRPSVGNQLECVCSRAHHNLVEHMIHNHTCIVVPQNEVCTKVSLDRHGALLNQTSSTGFQMRLRYSYQKAMS